MILLDPRAGSKDLYPYLLGVQEHPTVEFANPQLTFGDIAFTGNGSSGAACVGIEHKRIGDILSCKYDNRFTGHQLPGLLETYTHCYLFIEGYFRLGKSGLLEQRMQKGHKFIWFESRPRTPYAEFWSWLTSIQELSGIRVRHMHTPEESASQIIGLYNWFQKPYNKHKSLSVTYVPPQEVMLRQRKRSDVELMMAPLPGIGWNRAEAIANKFTCMEDVMAADVKSWREVEGIGKTLAARIVAILHTRR